MGGDVYDKERYFSGDTLNYIPAADRTDIDEILRRYETVGVDTTLHREYNYRRTTDHEMHSTSSNYTFGYNE